MARVDVKIEARRLLQQLNGPSSRKRVKCRVCFSRVSRVSSYHEYDAQGERIGYICDDCAGL